MRLTWLSNAPFTPTGYGQQTALITPRLAKAGHPVGVIANFGHQGNSITWQNVNIFGSSYHPYCLDIMHGHSENFKADALVTLMDLQVFQPDMLLGTKWAAWFPSDHHTIPPPVLERVRLADYRITMSKHASAEMDKTGLDYDYIPCGIDTSVFFERDRAKSREEMQLPVDKFIVGMVAMNKGNPSRKAFLQNIAAFAALQKKHKDCVLYLHTADGTRGAEMVNLVEYLKALGLSYGYTFGGDNKDKDVIFANQYGLAVGYDPDMMAKLYSAFDVSLQSTMGEGFGIPIIEAQACGTPVIVGDWTSMPELCFSGWKIDKSEAEPIFTAMGAFQFLPHTLAIAERLEAAYQMRGNQDYRKRAKAGVYQYDIERLMTNKWLPAIEKMSEKFKETKDAHLEKNLDVLR